MKSGIVPSVSRCYDILLLLLLLLEHML